MTGAALHRRALMITVSDRCSAGTAVDRSGPAGVAALTELGWTTHAQLVPDGEPVATALREAIAADYDLVITSGGTGVAPRDLTPEMTRPLLERELPGIPELLRRDGFAVAPGALLSRGLAGVAGTTLIINLPGSPGAVRDAMRVLPPVLEHAVKHIHGDTEH